MTVRNLYRLLFCVMLLLPHYAVISSVNGQSLPYYKSEKIIVGESWMLNINTHEAPRVLKSTQIGSASFSKAGNGYLLQYDNNGIAEYDTIVFTADSKIHAYALKNQFIRIKEDYVISRTGHSILVDVLANDETFSNIHLTDIPFEEGVKATIQQGKVLLETPKPGLYHFYYTACDGSGYCDEAKVTVFVMEPSARHDTIVLSEVIDHQLTLPLPNAEYQLAQSTIQHVYPDGNGAFDIDLFRQDLGQNEILFQDAHGNSFLYKINFVDKWEDNKLNTRDKVYIHPGKSAEVTLTKNDLWVNIFSVLSSSPDIQVSRSGSGRVRIQPKPGFSGKSFFKYVTCAYPRCDTTIVDVFVDHFKPAKDQFDIFVDPAVAYFIPFYTPSNDYQLTILDQPVQGQLNLVENGLSLKYTPDAGFSGEDKAKIGYSYQTPDGSFHSVHYIRFLPSPHPFRGKCMDCVWPGDTDENGVVDLSDIGPVARYIGEQGPARSEGSLWKGQWNYPWMNFEHKKLNHYDANGDGLISWEDLPVIVDYFGQTHGLYSEPVTWMDIPVVVDRSHESVKPGDELVFEFNVGDEDHELYNVTGFSAEVKAEGQELGSSDVEVVRDEDNWLKSHQPTMTIKAEGSGNGQVSAGEFRVRSVGVKGYGTALKLRIIVEDEVEGFRTLRAKSNSLKFNFRNIKIHTGNGDIQLPDQIVEIPLKAEEKFTEEKLQVAQVYPNPAREEITVKWPGSESGTLLEVLDFSGQRYKKYNLEAGVNKVKMMIDQLSPGVYILRCTSGNEVWNQKLTIIR